MTKQVQRRRGSASQHTSFTGAEGELSVNTTNKSVHVHDGSTAGGIEAARADLDNVSAADIASGISGGTVGSLTITSADVNGGTIDGTTIGGTTAAAGTFTTLSTSGAVTVGGDLTVNGTTTTINSTTLTVDDLNVVLASGAADATAANGAGLTIDGASATFTYASTGDKWTMNKDLDVTGSGTFTSAIVTGDLTVDTNTLYVDSTNNRVGIGVTSNLGSALTIARNNSVGFMNAAGTASDQIIYGDSSSNLRFYTLASERMRIDSSGNVGIGTTPEDWYAGFSTKALQLGGTTSLWSLSNGSTDLRTTIDNNLYVSAAGTNTYLNTGPAERYQMINGTHRWSVAASGTADTAATFSEAMRIDSSGNVGIGTSSPVSYYANRLVVTAGYADGITVAANTTTDINYFMFADAVSAVGQGFIGYNHGTNSMNFGSNSTERMTIDSSGNVGIGTSSPTGVPTTTLHINGTTNAGIHITDSASGATDSDGVYFSMDNPNLYIQNKEAGFTAFETNATERMRIASGGQLFLFNQTSGAGNATLKYTTGTGAVTYDTSSRLVKENIVDCPYGLAEIVQLQPRKYFRIDDQANEVGLIADEVQSIMPEFVPTGEKSLITGVEEDTEIIALGVNYDKMVAPLVQAIKDLNAKIETLEEKVAALENA